MGDTPKNLAIRRTDDLQADLEVVVSTGISQTEAVKTAMKLLANVYRQAWDYGDVPEGTAPDIIGLRYWSHDGTRPVCMCPAALAARDDDVQAVCDTEN